MSTLIKVILGLSLSLGISALANASEVMLQALPTNGLKIGEATKLAKETPIYKCEKVRQGPNGNPIKVKGSTTVWAKDVGTGIENAGELLSDGKTVARCKTVLYDTQRGRIVSAGDL